MKLRQLSTAAPDFEAEFQRLQHWSAETDAAIESRVAEIIADVRARGDAAVLACTARFDAVQATAMAEVRYRTAWESSEQDADGVTSVIRDLDVEFYDPGPRGTEPARSTPLEFVTLGGLRAALAGVPTEGAP